MFPSSQVNGLKTQPVAGSQESRVQELLSLQHEVVYLHPVRASQVSTVQAILSSQTIGVNTQLPLVLSQESVVQRDPSEQGFGVCVQVRVQTQGPEAPSVVQASESSQFKIDLMFPKVTVESSVLVRV
jgi:hypothetical protein